MDLAQAGLRDAQAGLFPNDNVAAENGTAARDRSTWRRERDPAMTFVVSPHHK